jgi:hypothetical protein
VTFGGRNPGLAFEQQKIKDKNVIIPHNGLLTSYLIIGSPMAAHIKTCIY